MTTEGSRPRPVATPAVVVTGLGAISALGRGVASIRGALAGGRDGIRPVTRIDVTPLAPVRLGGMVDDVVASASSWALEAAREAWASAGLPTWGSAPIAAARVAVVVGTTDGDARDIAKVARDLAAAIGAGGAAWTISTACASSANALGLGRDLLLEGEADLVVAGGVEALTAEMFAGFTSLGVLAVEPCAPFGETTGTTLGEGAGFVVLERAGERDAPPRAYLLGYGLSSDAWHETSPDPRGEGIARAMAGAMADAGVAPGEIGYVNAHATGTAANDDSEWRGIERALGARARAIPVNGSKSFFGHAQGAAGILELLATLVSLERGEVPPSLRAGKGRLRGPSDLVPFGASRARPVEVALKNSAAFGGANAVVAVSMETRPAPPAARRVVRIVGVGRYVTPAGVRRDEAALARAAGPVELRGTDPSSRLVAAAVAGALSDARLRVRGSLRDRFGIFGAATRLSPASGKDLLDSIEAHGPARASVSAFARLVLHAPTGAASRLFGLRGPTTTLACEPSGLFALAYATRWLRRRGDADLLAVAAVDERGLEPDDATRDADEGAACVILSALEAPPDDGAPLPIEVAGVAATGPGEAALAVERALADAGIEGGSTPRTFAFAAQDLAPSLRSLTVVLDAIDALRAGEPAALVVGSARAGSVAVVLRRPPAPPGAASPEAPSPRA